MIKFRTMKLDAEREKGPAWAKPEDFQDAPSWVRF
jgi:lipopolysaccharide/colanic/teichoic acid biosynthesis glycosyltransferase